MSPPNRAIIIKDEDEPIKTAPSQVDRHLEAYVDASSFSERVADFERPAPPLFTGIRQEQDLTSLKRLAQELHEMATGLHVITANDINNNCLERGVNVSNHLRTAHEALRIASAQVSRVATDHNARNFATGAAVSRAASARSKLTSRAGPVGGGR